MKGLFVLVLMGTALMAQDISARERALQEKLVASCCWSESIAFHRSEAAAGMRAELHKLIEEGQDDAEILEAFRQKYGRRVLIEPQGGASLLIYTVPAIAGILGLFAAAWCVRRWVRRQPA